MTFSFYDDSEFEVRTAFKEIVTAQGAYVFPASFAQERLWFLDQFEPGGFIYNIPSALRLRGRMQLAALRRSISELVRRHETLRTSFVAVDGRPMQSIATDLALPLPLIDFSELGEDERAMVIQQTARDEGRRSFDLARGPLIRTTLLRLHADEHILLLTLHHSIADGWSTNVCFNDLNTLYTAFAVGQPSPLVELPIQYADYAAWQREWLQGEALEQELSYWKTRLRGTPTVLELPSDHPRPVAQTYNGARYYFRLPASLAEALDALSRKRDATLFMTLLAAFQALLSRLTGQQDIVVGTPIAGRTQFELESLIGFFVNTLVLRSDLASNPSFEELLAQVSERALEAFEHQELPFDRVVDALQPERSLRHHPLFQVFFAFQNAPQDASERGMAGWQPVELNVGVETAKFDLSLLIWKEEEGLGGAFDYNTDLFECATIARWVDYLRVLLTGIVGNPRQRMSDLPLLTAQERRQMLIDWNATQRTFASDVCLQTLFEQQVERTPEAIALAREEEQLSYGELDARARQLAHYLWRQGVGPEGAVGVCVERSLAMVIGVMGVLKAGGAYVPLDTSMPTERLAFQLHDAQVTVVLTDRAWQEQAPDYGVKMVNLESSWSELAQESAGPFRSGVRPENLAYIMYTSGSTGQPKGVMVTHGGLVNYLCWAALAYNVAEGHGSLLHSSLAFDLSVTALFTPLLVGQRVRLLPEERDIEALGVALSQARHLSLVKLTPAHLAILEQQVDGAHITDASDVLILGGEALLWEQVALWRRYAPATRLINEYGPTETVVGCCIYELPGEAQFAGSGSVPIGRPIANTQLYILDAHLQPAPIGVVGELVIGGAGVARGYLRRSELTAGRFVPHAFSQAPGARMYRTGDRARFLHDGTIEYLGRADGQVKVRGYRVELGEIETTLAGHAQVQAAVVLQREINAGDKRLVAYIVPEPEAALTALELRAYLRERLPEFMVPAFFVQLDALPVTTNGKLDRRALPLPERDQATNQTSMAPRTAIEAKLAQIWEEILRIKGLGINTNFFEAGGDSILSLLVIARAREAGLVFTPKHIFQYQTIGELAKVVVAATADLNEEEAARGQGRLTPIQQWFFEQGLAEAQHWNQAMLLEVTDARINPQLVEQALVYLLEQHSALSLRFKHTEQGWQQYSADTETEIGDVFWTVDVSTLAGRERESRLEEESALAQASLDLSVGPLIRVVYFAMGEGASRLLLVIHHLVVDGVSWRILLDDLRTVCQQLLQRERPQLAQKTTAFTTWAERLHGYARSAEIQQEAGYWLASERWKAPALPVDFGGDGSLNSESSMRSVAIALSAEETDALLHKAGSAYHTQIHELLLTALVLACAPWTGKGSLLVNVEGHGREEVMEGVDISRTVGWFTTLYPVILDLEGVPGGAGLGNAIKAVKEQIRGIPKHGIGYGLLLYDGDAEETRGQLRGMPKAELSFNYLGQFGQHAQERGQALFRPARESGGPVRSLQGERSHLLDVIAIVENGVFLVEWSFSLHFHRSETIEAVARRYLERLRALIEHCCASEAGGYTPSDFTGAGMSQAKLDKFMAKIRSK